MAGWLYAETATRELTVEHELTTASGPHTNIGDPVNLSDAADELVRSATTSRAGRAGRTLIPGAGAPLKQVLLALAGGQALADHESPAAATLQVLRGVVRLTGGGQDGRELHVGDLVAIPPVRHGLEALDDAVVLLTVAQGTRPETGDRAPV